MVKHSSQKHSSKGTKRISQGGYNENNAKPKKINENGTIKATISKSNRNKKKAKHGLFQESQNAAANKPRNKSISKVEQFKEKLDAGRFRFLNEQLYTTTGSESFEYFTSNPDSYVAYHKGFSKQVEKWPNHPLIVIMNWLKKQKDRKTVYDLGCGEAKIAEAVGSQHKVLSFDFVATNDYVTVADMADLPVANESADIVIFCLSLMGTNLLDFIKEARRVLKNGGILKIAEVSSRFYNVKKFCEAICKTGFVQLEKRDVTDYFVMLQFAKAEKVENKRPLGLKLKPCIYKKR